MSKFLFGDIVVVDDDQIGVIVKSWGTDNHGNEPKQEVYVRNYNAIVEYPNSKIERYHVRHKYLDEDELSYQQNGVREP